MASVSSVDSASWTYSRVGIRDDALGIREDDPVETLLHNRHEALP
jgi:hypothetical protein